MITFYKNISKPIIAGIIFFTAPSYAMLRSSTAASGAKPSAARSVHCRTIAQGIRNSSAWNSALTSSACHQSMPLLVPASCSSSSQSKQKSHWHHNSGNNGYQWKSKKSSQSQANLNNAKSWARGGGLGLGIVALAAQAVNANENKAQASQKEELAVFKSPFDEQRLKYYKELESKPWGEVSKKYIKQLQEEEKQLMKELFEKWNISENDWNNILMQHNKIYNYSKIFEYDEKTKDLSRELSETTKNKIDNLLSQLDINLASIKTIEMIDDGTMIAKSFWIEICQEECDKFSSKAFDAIFLHEIQHVLQQDDFIGFCIGTCLQKFSKIEPSSDEYINCRTKFSHFKEKRADILSCLANPDYIQAVIFELERVGKESIWPAFLPTLIHPARVDRIAYLKQLHQEMLEAIEKNKQDETKTT